MSNLYDDLVIDCETLSLAHSAAIWQIGAVCGDQTFERTINPSHYGQYDPLYDKYDVASETIDWQAVHNLENYNDAFTVNPDYGPAYLLDSLINWVKQLPTSPKAIWSRHPIDITWLTYAAKVEGRVLPWKYYQCFDLATVAYLAGERLSKPTDGAHTALIDARFDYMELRRLKEKMNYGLVG